MEPGAEEISAGSNSSGMHSLQCSSQQQVNMHQQQKEEIQQQGEQQHQQLMQEWQQQLEDHSDQQEQFERGQTQHPEQSHVQPYVQSEHQHLELPQLQQKQHWQPEQQVQMQQMLQHSQQHHLQEMHSQQQKVQQPQHQQELVPQLQQQLQPQQQESPSQSEQQDMAMQLQQQELPLQELALQLQQQELALQLQQQQLPPQMPHEHLKQLPQTQQQQLEQSPAEPQQQHLQQLQQSQQHLQQPQQQQHSSQHFPLQTQQYVPQSQQQPQQSSLEPQHQHMQPLSEHQLQQLPLHSQQQHLPQPQQQTQQQQLQILSQHQQQSQQLPLQSQEQHLPQSQQKPQQQVQQSPLPSQHQHLQQLPQPQQQPQLQQAPLPSQQQHLQQLAQSQQQPQQKLQQLSLQQQQQHLQQSQQQAQQHLQQSSMSSHQQQTQQQLPQPQQQLPQPQQQHLQQLSQPQKQHLQQLPQPQQQRSQQLPHSQQQPQQPQPQQQRSQLQPHLQQLSQSQQQLQQKQLQPQQQQQQLSNQQPSQPAMGQATTSVRGQNASGAHSISFGSLIPMILPHLSKEQSDRLQGLYTRLRRNEVTKEDFLRATRNVVGDQMLVQAVRQMQQKHQAQSQPAPSSQASQLQQQQRQQQHVQGSSQQFMPQQSIHTQQLNEPQPFQQVSPANLQSQTQRTSDYQPHPHSSAPASLTASHSSSDNKTQQSRQSGEQRPEISSVHGNQTSTMNLHQVKHEVDRTMIGFPLSNQQQQQHLQGPPSSFPMYGRPPGNYSSQSFSSSPGIPSSGVKSLAQDSQTKQVMHPQVGVQAQGGPPQLSNIKHMPKYDVSKQAKRREDDERQKILQSSGASHFSGQHQPSVWATSLDKEKAVNTGILPSSSVHIKQEINENSDQQHNLQTLQPMKDNLSTIKSVPIDHGQSLILTKTESVEHQSIKTSGISSGNHPLGSTGLHSDHLMQPPLATPAATLHHTLSGFSGPVQMRPQVPSTPPSSMIGSQIKTPPKKMLIGQKKPFEVTGTSIQLASKKQKVSAGYLDQSIDQLNDVTAVSGVNLREEEEQLFAGPKEESRATEAMRKVVQEEEERTFLQKGSLRAKLAGIVAKYGIKYISSDSERCLSLCVEERLRTMIGHLIRLSKQRVDLEKVSHKVTITSDVRRQILAMNKKAKDDLEKKQAEEAEKLRKLNEIENVGPEGEKDETRTKAQKAQKEEDDKMRANAANVAARAAVGGDDMLSKWQLMAEQARQKREGTSDGASNTRTNRDANRKSVVGGLKSTNVSDHQDAPSPGIVRNLGRTSGPLSQTKPVRSICIKDVIALLEREPQMTKSTLLYRLYERGVDCSKEKGTEIQNNENTLQ
ncbi:uncharacterized protein LOC131067681 isoform X2 [Cryptomeria japonica]|uniref:uncharacterized protein LOC131067681 isoform X2 n=1 Tax=Cryptomeria japonica TaxID=3369 RepID=UPI0025ACD2D9|nr:uncharacterized protein LOC131067681 isoform X2 [Cryptomeria japonica]